MGRILQDHLEYIGDISLGTYSKRDKDAVYLIECVRLILDVSGSSVMSVFAYASMQLYAYLSKIDKHRVV